MLSKDGDPKNLAAASIPSACRTRLAVVSRIERAVTPGRVGAGNCVVAGQAAFRYSLMSPSQRAVLRTWRCLSGWSGGSVATGGCWSSERWGRCVL